jgi:hypothetical protein
MMPSKLLLCDVVAATPFQMARMFEKTAATGIPARH